MFSAGATLSGVSGGLEGVSAQLRGLPDTLASWRGPASISYGNSCLTNGSALSAAERALSQCAVVAQSYARDLDEAQDDARAAIKDAREAQRRIDRAEVQLADARQAGAAAVLRGTAASGEVLLSGLTGSPNAGAMADLDAARADADAAGRREAAASRELEGAQEDLRAAKKRGERAEGAAEDAARAAAGAFEGLASASPAAVYAGQVAQAREAARVKAKAEEDDGGILGKIVHGALDVGGLVPVIGEPADLANAGIYALEGDEVNAALSAASAIPIAGYGATGIKAGRYADEAIEGADTAKDAYRAATPGGAVKSEGATASVGRTTDHDYRRTFFGDNPDLRGQVTVHHAVEQQVQKRYPDLFDADELHSLENLRGIPNADNSSVHLSEIRREWNRFYKGNPNPTREQVLEHATTVDRRYGGSFRPPR